MARLVFLKNQFTGKAQITKTYFECIPKNSKTYFWPAVGPLLKERLLAGPVMQALRAIGPICQSRVLALPRRGWFGRSLSVLAPVFAP